MASKKQEQFALPTNVLEAKARMQHLALLIRDVKPLVEQLEKLLSSKDVLRAAEAEMGFINENLDGIRRAEFERQVDEYEIAAITPIDEGSLANAMRKYNVQGTYEGRPFEQPLANQSRVLLAAVARRPDLIPAEILARGSEPFEALLKNVLDVNRGYRT
jgi:hypothetical protein